MKLRLFSMLPLLAVAIVPGLAFGDALYNVSVDTSSLIGNPAGPFQLDFQFTDGSGIGDANNIVTLSNFDFGSGSASGAPTLTGGGTGDLSTAVTLRDSEFFNEFAQAFTPGSAFGFRVDLTTNPESINVPDQFSFAILDSSGLGDTLLTADIFSTGPSVSVFASSTPPIPAPNVSSVPEPSLAWPLAAAFCLLLIRRNLAHRRHAAVEGQVQ